MTEANTNPPAEPAIAHNVITEPLESEPLRVDYAKLVATARLFLEAIGEDGDRPGLVDTPNRFADAWKEFIEYDPGKTGTVFDSITEDQMVVVGPMRIYSICEHHLLPFWADVTIGYITGKHVLGLSKFARVAHKFAHRLQIQERLGTEICHEIQRLAGTDDVAVVSVGEHSCMTTRGIKTAGFMNSTIVRGRFKSELGTRTEFIQHAQHLALGVRR